MALKHKMTQQLSTNNPTPTTHPPQLFTIPPPCFDIKVLAASICEIDTDAIAAHIVAKANWPTDTPYPSSTNDTAMMMTMVKTIEDGDITKTTPQQPWSPMCHSCQLHSPPPATMMTTPR